MNKTLEYFKNKYNLDYSKGSPIEFPEVGRLDLLRWLRELNFKTGVEIGVERGEYSKLICEMNTQMKVWGIDPWFKYEEYREYNPGDLEQIYKMMLDKMKNYIADGQYTPVRKKSMDALADFKDNSLDFVYIDGNHEDNFPYDDIAGWMKKVKKGGILAGHDYVRVRVWNFTIKDALDRYTKENNIHPWFILGRYQKRNGEVRDRTRSWMIVKQ
jgi:hypothetical protein